MAEKHDQQTFVFPAELGVRLRALRLRAGLNQQELAEMMGRTGKGSGSLISRLELGQVGFPTLALIADYIRACRADFKDIADILTGYTSRPRLVEEQGRKVVSEMTHNLPRAEGTVVDRYDVKTTIGRRYSGSRPLSLEQRVTRARKYARTVLQRRRLFEHVASILDRAPGSPGFDKRTSLQTHAQRVWRVLRQTRRRPEQRESAMELAHRIAVSQKPYLAEGFKFIETEVAGLFSRMEASGDLDRLPAVRMSAEDQKGEGRSPRKRRPKRRKPRVPAVHREFMKLTPEQRQRQTVMACIRLAVNAELEQTDMEPGVRSGYFQLLGRLFGIAVETEGRAVERQRRLEQVIAGCSNPQEARSVVERYLHHYERWKRRLPG